jgi:hypothetical protein
MIANTLDLNSEKICVKFYNIRLFYIIVNNYYKVESSQIIINYLNPYKNLRFVK